MFRSFYLKLDGGSGAAMTRRVIRALTPHFVSSVHIPGQAAQWNFWPFHRGG
jgi:hypothetical protein